jgi:trehalose/maltose transport system permease protein
MTGAFRDRITRYSFLLPAVLFLALIALLPILSTFWLSFRRQMPVFGISEFVGAANYLYLARDQRFWSAAWNTAYFTFFAVSLEMALGLALAILLNLRFPGRGLARALVLVPWAVPSVVAARFWAWILNVDFGVLNYLLGARINWLGDPFWALNAAVLADVWKTTPFVVLLLLAGLQVIPDDLYRAARVDGANRWQSFRYVTLPMLLPVILLTLLFRTMDAARVFDIIFVLTGGGPANASESLVVYAYKLLYRNLQFGYGSAISVATFLFILALSLVYVFLLRRVWEQRAR